ncbi:MFS transporter [Thermococcus sp. JCM 11816]|uniref:MFS transporter n=1 Tax=Thermococcus sp. (strain JCM 11816 / KS-1) TaxID=1295125 RepID=UPI0006D0B9F0
MERRRLAGIVLLVLSAFTGTLAFRLATPAIAFYTRDTLSASMLAVSIVSMSFVLARAFSSVFGGLLLEKRKSLLHIGGIAMMGGNALAVHLYPLTSNWIQVAGIKLLNGFLNGLSWPMAQFVVAVATPREIRARVTAVYFFFGSIASLIGNYAYAYTIDLGLSGQMWVSSVFFVLTGLIMIIAYILLNDWVAPKREKKSSQRPSLDPGKVLVIASLMAVIVAFTSGEITYVYVSEALGLEKATTATLLGGWVGFFASLLSYFSSWFADKVSEVGMVKLTAVLAGISPILAAVKTSFTVFFGIFLALFAFQSFRPISRKVLASYHRSSLAIGGGVNGVQNLSTFIGGGVLFGLAYSIGEIPIGGVTLNGGALLAFTPVSLALLIQAVKLKGGRE